MTTFTVTVELEIDDGSGPSWLDITRIDDDTRVLAGGDGASGVQIVRGGTQNESAHIAPTSVDFTYLDNNSTLDGENPASPYYRQIALGSRMRVSMDGDVRAVVKLSKWELQPTTDANGNPVVFVAVEGVGELQELQASDRQYPLRSPAYRALSATENDAARIFYAPLEEESGATDVTTVGGGEVFTYGDVTFGGGDSNSSARLASLGTDAMILMALPAYTSTEHKVGMLWRFPDANLPGAPSAPLRLECDGDIDSIEVQVTGTNMRLRAFNGSTTADETSLFDMAGYIDDGQEFYLTVELAQDGADLDVAFLVVREDGEAVVPTDTWTGISVTRITSALIGFTDAGGSSVGQFILGNDTNAFNNFINGNSYARGTTGFLREPAAVRIDRMSDEENGISAVVVGSAADTILLGPQGTEKTLFDVIDKAAGADMGILADDRDSVAPWYRTRQSMYNQAAALALTYSQIQPGFRPETRDNALTNEVTVGRDDGGGSATYRIPDGDPWHWTTETPPDGAGPRKSSATVNVADDDQLDEQAAWRAHLSAWREKRYPQVTLELAKGAFDADARADARAVDLGDLLVIDMSAAPSWFPYSELRLLVRGYVETLSKFAHTITYSTAPADPYEVDTVTAGPTSILAAPVAAGGTSLKIAPGDGPEWSTADEPFHLQLDGDPVTVTSISTDGPTFIAAGAVSYGDNASLTPALPAGMTPDVGQAMIAVVFCRQTGSGIVGAAPTGYEEILRSPDQDWVIFGRYYRTGDAAVQYTFSGGAAGNTTGAVVLGFSGLSLVPDKNVRNNYPLGYARSVNASAQNVAFPTFVLRRASSMAFIIGKKDDDWTSVAAITTERVDSSSLTGNDIGIVINTSVPGAAPSTVSGNSFTVTGGAAAVSEGVTLGLRPLQTATVTRGVAGTALAHSIGAEVHAWRSGVNGL